MRAIERGWKLLESRQQNDGSFKPLWFGNEYQPEQRNFVYGTSLVLLASADLERYETEMAQAQPAGSWRHSTPMADGGRRDRRSIMLPPTKMRRAAAAPMRRWQSFAASKKRRWPFALS